MMKFAAALAALLVLSTPCLAAQSSISARLDAAVTAEVPNGFSGAVLVARGHATLLDKGYGSLRGVAVKANSRFWIASAGKQFASAAILKCAERGWLTLDDPLSRFIPGAPGDKHAITLRQLLSHTSGLDQTYASEGASDRGAAVARMLSHPLIDTPGHKFHYSNDNYQLAAAVVEIASGEDYKTFATRELFRRAGLRDTGFAGTPGAKIVLPGKDETPARLAAPSWGMEGVYSTTGDLLRWYRTLKGGHMLAPRDAALLFAPVAPIQEGQTALGWFVGHTSGGATRVFTRGNEDWGPNSLLYAYPDSGIVIIVLSHAGDANDDSSWSRRVHGKLEAMLVP